MWMSNTFSLFWDGCSEAVYLTEGTNPEDSVYPNLCFHCPINRMKQWAFLISNQWEEPPSPPVHSSALSMVQISFAILFFPSFCSSFPSQQKASLPTYMSQFSHHFLCKVCPSLHVYASQPSKNFPASLFSLELHSTQPSQEGAFTPC